MKENTVWNRVDWGVISTLSVAHALLHTLSVHSLEASLRLDRQASASVKSTAESRHHDLLQLQGECLVFFYTSFIYIDP